MMSGFLDDDLGGISFGLPGSLGTTTSAEEPMAPEIAPVVRVSIAVVEPDGGLRDRILRLLPEGATPFSSIEEVVGRVGGGVPVVVVLGPSCATEVDFGTTGRMVAAYRNVGAVLVAEELTTTLLQQALRAGVRDVLALAGDASALAEAIERVAVTLEPGPDAVAAMPDPDEIVPHEDAEERVWVDGKVITVFSTKGGAGKSMLATNLAVALAQRSDQPVCLVDADLQFGDVAVMLKLAPRHTIVDAVAAMDRLDAAMLDNLLVTHEPSGLRVLPAPLEPAFADQVSSAEMVAIIDTLRSFCGYVVIDTPAYFNDVVLGLVETSDQVLLLAGMDIPNVKNLKIGLQTLRLLNTPMEKLRLVLNRANSKVKLDVGEVERTLQMKAESLIPSDVTVPQAVNRGEPVLLYAPKSTVSKAIGQLADMYVPAAEGRRRK